MAQFQRKNASTNLFGNRFPTILCFAAALGLSSAADLRATVDIQRTADFPLGIKKIAIAPLFCSEALNCIRVERLFTTSAKRAFKKANISVIDVSALRAEMFERSITETQSKEQVLALSAGLDCDAVIFPTIVDSAAETPYNIWIGSVVSGTCELVILSVDDDLLVHGRASTNSSMFSHNQTSLAAG